MSEHTARRTGRLLLSGAAVALLAGLLLAVGWRLAGGRWQNIESPSMGRAAPVGTLVITRRVPVADLKVGDIVTLRPPIKGMALHTHRIVAIEGARITTRGDINGADDPWPLGQHDLVGVVVIRAWAMGWLITALPLLVAGTLIVFVATARWADRTWRAPLRLVGACLVVCVAALVYRPFVGMELVSTTSQRPGTATAHIVATGLLPISVSAGHGGHVALRNGWLGDVSGPVSSPGGRVAISAHLHLSLAWWAILILLCAMPLLTVLGIGLPPAQPARAGP